MADSITITVAGVTTEQREVAVTPEMTVGDLRTGLGISDTFIAYLHTGTSRRKLEDSQSLMSVADDGDTVYFDLQPD